MPDQTAHDQTTQDPRRPDWPLPDLRDAAEAHWDDAPRLRLLLRDLEHRTDRGARELLGRVTARLRDFAPEPARPRVIRRDPAAFARVKAAPLPQEPTPEMAALLRQLQVERASSEQARQEAATLRQRLSEARAADLDDALRRDLAAARAEARAARQEAARLAERLAFASSPASRLRPEPAAPPPRPEPHRPRADPAYAELGLSPDMPDELIPVLERALLRHHHPDRAAPEAREAATQRFQSVTLAFARIRKLRGL